MDTTTFVSGGHPNSFPGADPQELGRYKVLGRLGAGGMGVVYLAQKPLEPRVAIKVMRAEFAHQPEFRARFAREVSAARAVSGDFTAQVVETDLNGAVPWIATEYVPGPTLGQQVAQAGPLPQEQARLLGLGLADALRAIHAAGLVHRDLKPGNILLAHRGPKVIDFGIAHAAEATSLTHTGAMMGSLAWMAPEQITGQPVSPASDVFALGLVLAYAASGRHPYGEGRPEALSHRLTTQQPDLTGVPEALRQPIAAMLALDPAERPTVPGINEALESTQDQWGDPTRIVHQGWDVTRVAAPQPIALVTAPTAPAARRSGRWAVIGATVVGTVALLASGIALANDWSDRSAPQEQAQPTPEPIIEPGPEPTPEVVSDDDAWPEFAAPTDLMSQSDPTGYVPQFASAMTGWRKAGPPETTDMRVFMQQGANGPSFSVVDAVPASTNGCSNQMFTVRWRALNDDAVVQAAWAGSYSEDVLEGMPVAQGSSGWMTGHGCVQPAFALVDMDNGDQSTLSDIVVEYQVWWPAV